MQPSKGLHYQVVKIVGPYCKMYIYCILGHPGEFWTTKHATFCRREGGDFNINWYLSCEGGVGTPPAQLKQRPGPSYRSPAVSLPHILYCTQYTGLISQFPKGTVA